MANTIKLKRGSGSDPGTSDLSVGELAIRTDTALLFTKNDGGSVVPIGISDGDKGDITVSSNGGTFTIDNDAVTYAKIQNVSATNRILGRDSSGAGAIEEITPANLRTMINVEDGATADQTASEILTLIKTVDGAGSGLDADTLDGISSASFLRSDTSDGFTALTCATTGTDDLINFTGADGSSNRGIAFNDKTAISANGTDTYLRLNNNSEFTNGVYTPLAMRADGGFNVDGTTVINGSAQVVASTITGALPAIDGSALTGISAGATGGGSDEIFYENGQNVTTDYTITNGKNAMSAGPITIDSGVTVTVGAGETLTIV